MPDKFRGRLDMNLLVNSGQRKKPFTVTAFIWKLIKDQSFVSCLLEPAWARRGKQLTMWHFIVSGLNLGLFRDELVTDSVGKRFATVAVNCSQLTILLMFS
ncbi:hypothetical protein CHARACLAT_024613 [Characodon lateralis]|uniref:Uncharacterized protein n=1 Tax=Characodon lateralis TaxID=208331 RepID=A0ABU7E380_9TELE|nr:hypothetical protein [Characodon lateralis]